MFEAVIEISGVPAREGLRQLDHPENLPQLFSLLKAACVSLPSPSALSCTSRTAAVAFCLLLSICGSLWNKLWLVFVGAVKA